jgi:hypothetical protein
VPFDVIIAAFSRLGISPAKGVAFGIALSRLRVSPYDLVALYVVPVGLHTSLFGHGVLLVDSTR